jgi:hypothetical protein
MARTRRGTRSGHGKRHNGKATLSAAADAARSRARMTIVGSEAVAPARPADDAKTLDAISRLDLRPIARPVPPTAPVNGVRRTSEQTQVADDLRDNDDASVWVDAPDDDRESAEDDTRRTLDAAWVRSLRFARSAMWALPTGAFGFAVTGVWGWPTPTAGPAGQSPGAWLVTAVLSLALALIGGVALAALLSATPGRKPAAAALVSMLTGTVLFVPVLGLVGVARPAIARLPAQIRPEVAGSLDGRLLDGPVVHWLGIGGLVLIGAGWALVGLAVLVSGMLNRVDGLMLLLSVSVAVASVYQDWPFLLVVAAMIMVAAGLGLSWTAWRLTPAGEIPDD